MNETKICPGCDREMSRYLKVCWGCFKYREDVTPLKYYEGSLEEWVHYANSRHDH